MGDDRLYVLSEADRLSDLIAAHHRATLSGVALLHDLIHPTRSCEEYDLALRQATGDIHAEVETMSVRSQEW